MVIVLGRPELTLPIEPRWAETPTDLRARIWEAIECARTAVAYLREGKDGTKEGLDYLVRATELDRNRWRVVLQYAANAAAK